MENTKLVTVLRVLTVKELAQLKKFMQSPLFYRRKEAITLFEYLCQFAPDYCDPKLLRSHIAQFLFPNQSDSVMSRATSELFQLLENYIAFQQADNNEIKKQLYILEFYASRQLDKPFHATSHYLQQLMNNEKQKNEMYYYNNMLLNDIISSYLTLNNDKQTDQYIASYGQNIDIFYVIVKLQYLCTVFNRGSITNTVFDISLLEEIIHFIQNNPTVYNTPTVQLYYHTLLMLHQKSDDHFFVLKPLLETYIGILNPKQMLGLYKVAETHCILALRTGKAEFAQHLLDLYQNSIKANLIQDGDGYIGHITFKNIITLYLRLQQIKEAQRFIDEYQHYLSPDHRQSVVDYSKGIVAYSEKNIQLAIDYFQSIINYPNIYFHLDTRKFLIRCYFEQEYYLQRRKDELLENAIISLQKFVAEQKSMIVNEKHIWQSYCKGMTKLVRIAVAKKTKQPYANKIGLLKTDMSQMIPIDQTWFTTQLNTLGIEEGVAKAK